MMNLFGEHRYEELREIKVEEKEFESDPNQFVSKLKKWSGLNDFNIVFDSDYDEMEVDHCVFNEKVKNKTNLYFIVFDAKNNVFGGYLPAKITQENWFVFDRNAFVFSLLSNDRLKKPMKFILKGEKKHAFEMWDSTNHELFRFGWGHDMVVYKGNSSGGECFQQYFNYKGFKNVLCDSNYYELERLLVIEMF